MLIQTAPAKAQSNTPIVLVCAADNNYAMPLAVTIRSVLENLGNGRKLSLFIIDGGIKEDNKHKLVRSINSDKVELTWLQPLSHLFDEIEVEGIPDSDYYYTKATYYRLCIPELLPQYKKAIYLDSDLIVLEDLGKLWDIDIEDHSILTAQDLYPSTIISPNFAALLQQTSSKICKHFNAGVLVINLEKWREEKVGIEAIKYVVQHDLHSDQEGLSIVIKDKWKEIDPRWNRTTGIYEYESWKNSPFSEEEFNNLINSPYVIHFTSAAKPWNSIGGCHGQPLFYHYLDMTAWSGWRFTQWKRIVKRLIREIKRISKIRDMSKTNIFRRWKSDKD